MIVLPCGLLVDNNTLLKECIFQTYPQKKMQILGLKPAQFVSEEYCYCTVMGSATNGCGEQLAFCNIHP